MSNIKVHAASLRSLKLRTKVDKRLAPIQGLSFPEIWYSVLILVLEYKFWVLVLVLVLSVLILPVGVLILVLVTLVHVWANFINQFCLDIERYS